MFHAEVVRRDGMPVGYIRAASYGFTLGGAVGLAMVDAGRPRRPGLPRQRRVDGRDRCRDISGRGLAAADVRRRQRAGPDVIRARRGTGRRFPAASRTPGRS